VVLKVLAGLLLFVAAANISAGEDLAIHWGTALLLLAASAILFFYGERRAKLMAGGFMCFTALLSHGVDKYFWSAVWDHGYPWPYSMKEFQGYGVIGSIIPFMNQVATVTFAISGFTAVALLGWHLTWRSSGPPSAAAEL
jgi:hypothetical protein